MTYELPKHPDQDSVEDRIIRNGIAVKRCTYVGAGFGGLVLLMGPGDLLQDAPGVFVPLVVTLIIFGGACLGLAYVPFLMALEILSTKNSSKPAVEGPAAGSVPVYQEYPHRFYIGAVLLLIAAALAVLIAVWLGFALSLGAGAVTPCGRS